jgi:replication initiator protein RepSA
MTEPVRVGEVLPEVVAEAIARAGPGYDRWMEQVAANGYCIHPVRLRGQVEQADRQTGEVRTVCDSEREPDGVLLKACGTRRESRCPSCAATYRADAYQLLAAGLKGGKGVPDTVAGHPRLFVTFTAPASARSTRAGPRGGWCCPVTPTGRAPAARTGCGLAAGTAMTRTTRGWGSRSARPATTRRRRCCGMRSRPSCGGGPPSPSRAPSLGWSVCMRPSCGGWSECRSPRRPSSNDAA